MVVNSSRNLGPTEDFLNATGHHYKTLTKIWPKVGQIGPKLDKFGTFFSTFWPGPNILKPNLKKYGCVLFAANMTHIGPSGNT